MIYPQKKDKENKTMKTNLATCVWDIISTCNDGDYDYDVMYDMVCEAMDDNGCSINDVDRVCVDLMIEGHADAANLLGRIITDMYIDRIIVPRIHAILDAKQMTPDAIAKEIYGMLCRYASSAHYVILVVLAALRWDDLGQQVIPYILPAMLAKYVTCHGLLDVLGALYRDGIIGGEKGEPVTLYRGVCDHNQDIGTAYSYTTDYEVARKFACGEVVTDPNKRGMDPGRGKIYTVRVDPKYIIGRYDDRGEAEVMVLPLAAGGAIMVDDVEYV